MFLKGFFYQSVISGGDGVGYISVLPWGLQFTWGTQKLGTAARGMLRINIFSHSLACLLLFSWWSVLSVASGMVAVVFHCCCFSITKFLLSAAPGFLLDTLAGFNPSASCSESRSFFSTLSGCIADERTPKNLTHMVVQICVCLFWVFRFLSWHELFLFRTS